MINSDILPTLKDIKVLILSPGDTYLHPIFMWKVVCPERNYSALIWNLYGAFNQLCVVKERFIFHLMKSNKYVLKFLTHSFASREPETTSWHPLEELLCASIARSFRVTTAAGLSSARLLKPDVDHGTHRISGCFKSVIPTEGNLGDIITDLNTWCEASRHQANYALGGKLPLQKGKMKVLQEKMPPYLTNYHY